MKASMVPVPAFVRDRAMRFDLCADCMMPRSDRHHGATYRMARSPYDIPRHGFVDPSALVVAVPADRPSDPCRHGHCVLTLGHSGDHLDRYGSSFPKAR